MRNSGRVALVRPCGSTANRLLGMRSLANVRASRAHIPALPAHRLRGSKHDLPNGKPLRISHNEFKHQCRAFSIRVQKPTELWQIVLEGSQVKHRIHGFQSPREVPGVRNVSTHELSFRGNPFRLAPRMHARLEVVENSYPVSAVEQEIDGVGADETSAAGHQNTRASRHAGCLTGSVCITHGRLVEPVAEFPARK